MGGGGEDSSTPQSPAQHPVGRQGRWKHEQHVGDAGCKSTPATPHASMAPSLHPPDPPAPRLIPVSQWRSVSTCVPGSHTHLRQIGRRTFLNWCHLPWRTTIALPRRGFSGTLCLVFSGVFFCGENWSCLGFLYLCLFRSCCLELG